jgi:hypothetical protein
MNYVGARGSGRAGLQIVNDTVFTLKKSQCITRMLCRYSKLFGNLVNVFILVVGGIKCSRVYPPPKKRVL